LRNIFKKLGENLDSREISYNKSELYNFIKEEVDKLEKSGDSSLQELNSLCSE
jgi:hypothetical protein